MSAIYPDLSEAPAVTCGPAGPVLAIFLEGHQRETEHGRFLRVLPMTAGLCAFRTGMGVHAATETITCAM